MDVAGPIRTLSFSIRSSVLHWFNHIGDHMPPQSRVGDCALVPADSHGNKCCAHSCVGPGVVGSPNLIVEGSAALRIGDPGVHAACCGANAWIVSTGSTSVTINDIPAARLGDITVHCGGVGALITGAGTLVVGG